MPRLVKVAVGHLRPFERDVLRRHHLEEIAAYGVFDGDFIGDGRNRGEGGSAENGRLALDEVAVGVSVGVAFAGHQAGVVRFVPGHAFLVGEGADGEAVDFVGLKGCPCKSDGQGEGPAGVRHDEGDVYLLAGEVGSVGRHPDVLSRRAKGEGSGEGDADIILVGS